MPDIEPLRLVAECWQLILVYLLKAPWSAN
jgi:hypothetical protein